MIDSTRKQKPARQYFSCAFPHQMDWKYLFSELHVLWSLHADKNFEVELHGITWVWEKWRLHFACTCSSCDTESVIYLPIHKGILQGITDVTNIRSFVTSLQIQLPTYIYLDFGTICWTWAPAIFNIKDQLKTSTFFVSQGSEKRK